MNPTKINFLNPSFIEHYKQDTSGPIWHRIPDYDAPSAKFDVPIAACALVFALMLATCFLALDKLSQAKSDIKSAYQSGYHAGQVYGIELGIQRERLRRLSLKGKK